MSFSFSSLVRLLVIVGLGVTLTAIGIARLDPPRSPLRTRMASKYFHINEYFVDLADRKPHWVDSETGSVFAHSLADGDVLQAASCSPWSDEKGQYQVVGRWSSRTKEGPMSISTDFGLARYSFPGGRMLDQVSTEIVPIAPPCWFPGTRARVLFVAGDGEIYQYAFEPDPLTKQNDPAAGRDPRPAPLAWICPRPGRGKVFVGDPSCPEDPRMRGYVVVTLREQAEENSSARSFTHSSLWWLRLDLEGHEIIEAGRLLDDMPRARDDSSIDYRRPMVGSLPNGHLVIAYQAERPGESTWDLRIAPIELEGDRGLPLARHSRSLRLSTHCHPSQPSFSADSRWLNSIEEAAGVKGRVTRIPLDKITWPAG